MGDSSSTATRWKRDAAIAGGAGAAAALCVGLAAFFMGSIGGLEARTLLESIVPTSRLLCSTVMGVTATILALMLTLLSFGSNIDRDLADEHFCRVKTIALYDALAFAFAAMLFLLHCVPVQESQDIPSWWYPTVYYFVLSSSAVITGAVVAIVLLLYLAVRDFVQIVSSDDSEHDLVSDPERSEREAVAG